MTARAFEPGYRGGGPIRSVARIIDSAPDDIEITLVTRDRDIGDREPYLDLSGVWKFRGKARIFYLNTRSPRQWARLLRHIRGSRFALLYTNSLWDPVFTVLPLMAKRCGLLRADSLLLAPRGELSPGAMSLNARRKRILMKALRPLLKGIGVDWHASGVLERDDILKVVPNGIVHLNNDQSTLPPRPMKPVAGKSDAVSLVFISRISPKKNVLMAIEAMGRVGSGIALDIYGPIDDVKYWRSCERAIDRLPSSMVVKYKGELRPSEVRATFSMYDAFVFPTMGENFGHVIAESLSSCCPVICSEHTYWTDVLKAGGGSILTDLSTQGLADAIDSVAARTTAERWADRLRAGEAYRSWQSQRVLGPHIFDEVRDSARDPRISRHQKGA